PAGCRTRTRRRRAGAARPATPRAASSGDRGVPAAHQLLLGRVDLLRGREGRFALDLGRRRGGRLVDGAVLLHHGHEYGPGEALQVEVLALGAVEELHPEAGRRRVRGVLGGGLRVHLEALAVGRHVDLPVEALGGQLRGVGGVVVVPVDADRGLALLDRGRGGLDGVEVADVLQLLEEVDAGLDVVEGAALGDRGGVHAGEGRARLGRVAVERDLALVPGPEQVGEARRAGVDLVGVAADGDVAA